MKGSSIENPTFLFVCLFCCFKFWRKGLSGYVDQADLELTKFPLPLKCCIKDCMCLFLNSVVINSRALYIGSKHSTIKP